MALTGSRTFVGFGFGAIQAGLFLYEAFHSQAFDRLVVAEVQPEMVAALRQADGYFTTNIAHADGIEPVQIGPVQIENPAVAADRHRLIAAIAEAEEIATAVPSVAYYASAAPGSLHRVLAQGLRQKITEQGPRVVIYAAENHNHAAEILKDKVMAEIPANEQAAVAAKVGFLNTVIGKMGGVHTEAAAIQRHGLAVLTPATSRAFLMESFNRILISQVKFDDGGGAPSFRRGIDVFEEKADLLPFEEAKLFGHNATHSMASYIAMLRGVHHLADLRALPDFMAFLRAAFIEESGAALIRKYGGTDPLFTQTGYTHYADNLLERMTNPFLRDTAERVGRDPARKLGWDDRLIGTLRLARRQQVAPQRYAFGAAAGLAVMDRATLTEQTALTALVNTLWREAAPESSEYAAVLGLIEDGQHRLKHWLQAGFPDLTGIF